MICFKTQGPDTKFLFKRVTILKSMGPILPLVFMLSNTLYPGTTHMSKVSLNGIYASINLTTNFLTENPSAGVDIGTHL